MSTPINHIPNQVFLPPVPTQPPNRTIDTAIKVITLLGVLMLMASAYFFIASIEIPAIALLASGSLALLSIPILKDCCSGRSPAPALQIPPPPPPPPPRTEPEPTPWIPPSPPEPEPHPPEPPAQHNDAQNEDSYHQCVAYLSGLTPAEFESVSTAINADHDARWEKMAVRDVQNRRAANPVQQPNLQEIGPVNPALNDSQDHKRYNQYRDHLSTLSEEEFTSVAAAINADPEAVWEQRALKIVQNQKALNLQHPIPPVQMNQQPSNQIDEKRNILFGQYELAENATKNSETFIKLYEKLPNPTSDDLNALEDSLINLFRDSDRFSTIQNNIQTMLRSKTTWAERANKMLWGISKYLEKLPQGSNEREVIKELLYQAFTNCINRRSTEIERIYYSYVERDLVDQYAASLTETELLIYELMQHRMALRDRVINIECPDIHNAASHNYFRRTLNEEVFHLPTAPLSSEDMQYQSYAMVDKRNAIVDRFNLLYNNLDVITLIESMLYEEEGSRFKFKPATFVAWLTTKGKNNADAFEDEDLTRYKPELLVEYLESLQFIRKKTA